MSNSVCLVGPAFSVLGETLFIDQAPSFSVGFNSPADSGLVIRYQWYLDDLLMVDRSQSDVVFSVANGRHKIGVRLLTASGWSGIKSLVFRVYPQPVYTINGPVIIREGTTAIYNVVVKYVDNTTEDITADYTFSTSEGTFLNNRLTIPKNSVLADNRNITITAKRPGHADLTRTILAIDTSELIVTKTEIVGPESIQEGSSGTYNVIATYSDQSTQTVTGYAFSATESAFAGNVLSIPENTTPNDDRTITVTANKAGATTLSKQVTILDKVYVFDEFDFLIVRFEWVNANGSDLDIKVKYENNGTPVDGIAVGFGDSNDPSNRTVPVGAAEDSSTLLWWGLDSTGGTGVEAVLVGIKKFITTYPASPNIVEVGLYASWFSSRGNGSFIIGMKTYLGGTISKSGNDFVNAGGTLVNAYSGSANTNLKNYRKVAVLKYNKTTRNATLQVL